MPATARLCPGENGSATTTRAPVLLAHLTAQQPLQWFAGMRVLPRKVLRGEVDRYLCKPVSPLFALLAEEMQSLASLQRLVSAGAIVWAICWHYELGVTLVSAISGLTLLLAGCVVLVLLHGTVSLLAFWLGDVTRLQSLLALSGELEQYPLTLFPRWLQQMLTCIVPVGLVSTFPALVFLGRVELAATYLEIAGVLGLFWSTVFFCVWALALRRYESFGG